MGGARFEGGRGREDAPRRLDTAPMLAPTMEVGVEGAVAHAEMPAVEAPHLSGKLKASRVEAGIEAPHFKGAHVEMGMGVVARAVAKVVEEKEVTGQRNGR